MKLDELVRQLQLAYGEGLRTVVLFGSAVAGEHNPKKSDYNVLVIVDSLPLERLRAVAAVSKAWAEDGNPPPMTFTSSSTRWENCCSCVRPSWVREATADCSSRCWRRV